MWHRSLTLFLSMILYLLPLGSQAAASDKNMLFLQQAQKYFNSFKTLQAKFIQKVKNQNGEKEKDQIDTGSIYIEKPGKFRFNYQNKLVIISTGDTVIYIDKDLEKTYYLKLEDTLLYLLSDNINFKDPNLKIENVTLNKKIGSISISSKKIEGDNFVNFHFNLAPFSLIGMDIGQADQIISLDLDNLTLNKNLDQKLFIYSTRP